MKCLLCERLSFRLICNNCNNNIKISPRKRINDENFTIYSFFDYQSIEYLLRSKYSLIGSRIYKILAHKSFLYFKNEINATFNNVYGIGIDDSISMFYSHSGIIVNEFKSVFKPLFGALISKNKVHYAGKSLEFRLNNKKDFIYNGKTNINAVLFDDIVTTGLSIKEARDELLKCNVNVLFALVLSDARY